MPSPEWLIERGIGETRAALVENGRILEARILREDVVPAGTLLQARLKSGGRNAVAIADGGHKLIARADILRADRRSDRGQRRTGDCDS